MTRFRIGAGQALCLALSAGAATATVCAADSPLRLEYCVQPSGGRFEYKFRLVLDNHDGSWAPGQSWRWVVYGDGGASASPLVAWDPYALYVLFSTSLPRYFTSTEQAGHHGPTLGSILDEWVPTAVGQRSREWTGWSTVQLTPDQVRFSTLATGGGAIPANAEVGVLIPCSSFSPPPPAPPPPPPNMQFISQLGTAPPPAMIGACTMTRFPLDTRYSGTPVSVADAPAPGGGVVRFHAPHSLRRIGGGWSSWSHGYTGDVYVNEAEPVSRLFLPPRTVSFVAYVQPSPGRTVSMTAYLQDGVTGRSTVSVSGDGGAAGFQFAPFTRTTGTPYITMVEFASPIAFAVGDFSICRDPGPCYAECNGDGVRDVRDFTCFQNQFALGDLKKADCTEDGLLDIRDFACFQNQFALGCP